MEKVEYSTLALLRVRRVVVINKLYISLTKENRLERFENIKEIGTDRNRSRVTEFTEQLYTILCVLLCYWVVIRHHT